MSASQAAKASGLARMGGTTIPVSGTNRTRPTVMARHAAVTRHHTASGARTRLPPVAEAVATLSSGNVRTLTLEAAAPSRGIGGASRHQMSASQAAKASGLARMGGTTIPVSGTNRTRPTVMARHAAVTRHHTATAASGARMRGVNGNKRRRHAVEAASGTRMQGIPMRPSGNKRRRLRLGSTTWATDKRRTGKRMSMDASRTSVCKNKTKQGLRRRNGQTACQSRCPNREDHQCGSQNKPEACLELGAG
mmetsp:Transcript_24783/g.54369  ORF Transcript_24783/g.54369 Transcript_24783/m.54369 type:complete len:250 (-) Transcript_24783:750-1499(-)